MRQTTCAHTNTSVYINICMYTHIHIYLSKYINIYTYQHTCHMAFCSYQHHPASYLYIDYSRSDRCMLRYNKESYVIMCGDSYNHMPSQLSRQSIRLVSERSMVRFRQKAVYYIALCYVVYVIILSRDDQVCQGHLQLYRNSNLINII